jgi:hypothetical protein
MSDQWMLQTHMGTIASNYDCDYVQIAGSFGFCGLFGPVQCRRTLFRKSEGLPLCLQRFVSMCGRCLSDVHSNSISASFWTITMDQDNKGQPQQGGQSNKPGQQGQQPRQNPGQQQTQQPAQKPGASET